MSNKNSHYEQPKYFEKLSKTDKEGYIKLRDSLNTPACKNRRNKSIQTFKEVIKTLKKYVIRNDSGDLNRSLVCGIMWLSNGIAINTHQMRLILSKCKSSINGSFQAMGYETIPTGADSASEIIKKYPFFLNNYPELRQWTIRQKAPTEEADAPKKTRENRSSHEKTNEIKQVVKDSVDLTTSTPSDSPSPLGEDFTIDIKPEEYEPDISYGHDMCDFCPVEAIQHMDIDQFFV